MTKHSRLERTQFIPKPRFVDVETTFVRRTLDPILDLPCDQLAELLS